MPFTPSGLVGEGIATVCSIHSGMALARSRVESIPHITALSSCGHEDENEGNLSRHGYVIIADHKPFEPPAPPEPFADLANVVSLAECDNVAIKISGACTLSHQPFPYPDIWEPLDKVFKAFSFERCMWGTDWTRAVGLLTYEQGVEAFRVTDQLSDSERSALMGGTLAKIYNWSPDMGE